MAMCTFAFTNATDALVSTRSVGTFGSIRTKNNHAHNTENFVYTALEHQLGTPKRHQLFDNPLMKGKEKVLTEVFISFTMYNLRRGVYILGSKELIK